MAGEGPTPKNLSFDQLSELREKTDAVAQFLFKQLQEHLETLRPLFAPQRLLGKRVPSNVKEDVVGADRSAAQLRERFKEVCGKPFSLPEDFDEHPLGMLENRLELYPWEYSHEAKTDKETKTVTMTTPVRWVLSYSSGYTLSQLRQTLAGQQERRADYVRQFVINALVMQMVLTKHPGLTRLLTDLRYQVESDKAPGLGTLPLVTIRSCVPSFRPADGLILSATRLSGVPAFIELIDPAVVQTLDDPLKDRIAQLLR